MKLNIKSALFLLLIPIVTDLRAQDFESVIYGKKQDAGERFRISSQSVKTESIYEFTADGNGVTTGDGVLVALYDYDPFGKLIEFVRYDPSSDSIIALKVIDYNNRGLVSRVSGLDFNRDYINNYIYDETGRKVRLNTLVKEGKNYILKEYVKYAYNGETDQVKEEIYSDAGGKTILSITYSYREDGSVIKNYGNGMREVKYFEPSGRISLMRTESDENGVVSEITYQYDEENKLIRLSFASLSYTYSIDYNYDKMGNLTEEFYSSSLYEDENESPKIYRHIYEK